MTLMLFATETDISLRCFTEDPLRLANQQHISACIVAFRRLEDCMGHHRNESVPRTYAPHHHRDRWADRMSENRSGKGELHGPGSIFANNPLSNQVHIAARIDAASHHS
jgi:hypothetical protein